MSAAQDSSPTSGGNRAVHERGTAHLCASLLSLAAVVYVAVAWLIDRPEEGFGTLTFLGWLAFAAGLLYLLSNALAEARRSGRLADFGNDRRGTRLAMAIYVAVLATMAWPAWRGPESRAFLVGLGPLLAACGTIVSVSLLLGLWDRIVLPAARSSAAQHQKPVTATNRLWWGIAERAPALFFVASLLAVETAPLPLPPMETTDERGIGRAGRSPISVTQRDRICLAEHRGNHSATIQARALAEFDVPADQAVEGRQLSFPAPQTLPGRC